MKRSLLIAVASVMALFVSALPALAVSDDESLAAASAAKRGADWRQYRGGADHRGVNRYETELSRTTVSGLELQWVANNGFNSSPAIADGVAYVSNGGLHAYPVACGTGGSTCSPLWTGNSGYADWSSPAVADGVVYISGSNGLSAYKVGCRSDGGVCSRLWHDNNAQAHFTSPTVAAGFVYLGTNDGWLKVYNADACRAAGGHCSPTWKAHIYNGLVYSSPAVADGMVYIGSTDGYLMAFKVGCGTGGATCQPVWMGNIHSGTVSTPAVGGGVVYIPSDAGELYAFPTSCRNSGPDCDPLWKAVLPPMHGSAALTDTAVYVTAGKRLYAFAVGCGSGGETCSPLWKSVTLVQGSGDLASSPAVANGVIYLGTQTNSQTNGRLWAFPAECGRGGATCDRLWRSQLLGGIVNSSPAVAHGMVYVASNSGQFYAFGLD